MKKKCWQKLQSQHGIEWQKGTHEEHLDVYNQEKKNAKRIAELEVQKARLRKNARLEERKSGDGRNK